MLSSYLDDNLVLKAASRTACLEESRIVWGVILTGMPPGDPKPETLHLLFWETGLYFLNSYWKFRSISC